MTITKQTNKKEKKTSHTKQRIYIRQWIRSTNPPNQTYTWSATEREGEDNILSRRSVLAG